MQGGFKIEPLLHILHSRAGPTGFFNIAQLAADVRKLWVHCPAQVQNDFTTILHNTTEQILVHVHGIGLSPYYPTKLFYNSKLLT